MDALILAAGLGSRLRKVEACKPLTAIHGLSLLETAVRQLVSAGANRVVIATGYKAAAIEAAIPAMATRAGVTVESVRVDDYRQPNGYSVLAGAAAFKGNFLLVMADHILSSGVFEALKGHWHSEAGAVLAIDRQISSPLIDPDDATWVRTAANGAIQHIGKELTEYNAVDCGAFLASPALLTAIRDAIADGLPGSLSDGMQRLADTGQALAADIGNAWWMDVDDAHALALAKTHVRAHLPELFSTPEAATVPGTVVQTVP